MTHSPRVAVGVSAAEDAVNAVRFAKDNGFRIVVQSTGHSAETPVASGKMITTKRLNHVEIEPDGRLATVRSGATWKTVIEESARCGLFPIAGSAPGVGTDGLLLGGGFGPLAKAVAPVQIIWQ